MSKRVQKVFRSDCHFISELQSGLTINGNDYDDEEGYLMKRGTAIPAILAALLLIFGSCAASASCLGLGADLLAVKDLPLTREANFSQNQK
jgi:hypothetical protein